MIRINNLAIPFDDKSDLKKTVAKRLKLPLQAVLEVVVVRKAIDARRRNNSKINFVYSLDVKISENEQKLINKFKKDNNVMITPNRPTEEIVYGDIKLKHAPIVIGLGPAGLLAAYTLAQHGYKPIVVERGDNIDDRTKAVADFWQNRNLKTESNIQFGEGGAGTFSDGKLTTRVSDEKMKDILELFVKAGAPEEIKYLHKPHIGTDKLRNVVKYLRQEIIAAGGEVRFKAKVTDIKIIEGNISEVIINGQETLPCEVVVLAIGHSARDTYEMLYQRNVELEAKPFAIGVRIEHPQELIDKAQYGEYAGVANLAAADYSLVYNDIETKRSAYSFCMCPGGMVVGATSEENQVVTNGMSNYQRNSGIANSAIIVTVNTDDFGGNVLDGISFQRKYEKLAFEVGGENYNAPMQTVGDFLNNNVGSTDFLVKPTYLPGVKSADLRDCLPKFVTTTIAKALPYFGQKIKGFDAPNVVMTGVETRTSAPVRIVRNKELVSLNTKGLYPTGEGAGYAGGIMSAAIDGMNVAIKIINKYKM